MDYLSLRIRKRAFSIVEVVVAVAIVSILATLVTINLTESKRTARDGNRKTDISTILGAVSQYATTNGSSLITYPDTTKTCSTAGKSGTNATQSYSGDGCVGASGRAYGKVNLYRATTAQDMPGGNAGRSYGASYSIIDALKQGGYFSADPKDPFNKDGRTTDPTTKDYVLIRACPNGQQHVGTGGQLYAVWTYLERGLTKTEDETRKLIPGDLSAIKDPASWGNHYDFAAGTEYSSYKDRGYAISNGVSNWNLGAAGCVSSPLTMAEPGR